MEAAATPDKTLGPKMACCAYSTEPQLGGNVGCIDVAHVAMPRRLTLHSPAHIGVKMELRAEQQVSGLQGGIREL